MSLIDCPVGAEISDIYIDDCPQSIGQVQKAIFQRKNASTGVKNEFVIATANPNVLASWTPLLAASDGTKVVQTPYLEGPETEPGAARTYGGGNETLGGIEIIIGREPTAFTAMVNRASQKTIEDMKKYAGEVVSVFLVDEFGRIWGLADDVTTPTKFSGIPIAGLFIGDKNIGGLEGVDQNQVMWKFFPNWSDKLTSIKPTDFNALTDLNTPA